MTITIAVHSYDDPVMPVRCNSCKIAVDGFRELNKEEHELLQKDFTQLLEKLKPTAMPEQAPST